MSPYILYLLLHSKYRGCCLFENFCPLSSGEVLKVLYMVSFFFLPVEFRGSTKGTLYGEFYIVNYSRVRTFEILCPLRTGVVFFFFFFELLRFCAR